MYAFNLPYLASFNDFHFISNELEVGLDACGAGMSRRSVLVSLLTELHGPHPALQRPRTRNTTDAQNGGSPHMLASNLTKFTTSSGTECHCLSVAKRSRCTISSFSFGLASGLKLM